MEEAIEIIDQEIEWCKKPENHCDTTPEQREWFIKGLEQAKGLLILTDDNQT